MTLCFDDRSLQKSHLGIVFPFFMVSPFFFSYHITFARSECEHYAADLRGGFFRLERGVFLGGDFHPFARG